MRIIFCQALPGYILVIFLLQSCDSANFHQSDESAATAKMKEKVKRVQAELRASCDSAIYREAWKMVDSILVLRKGKTVLLIQR